jgi:hypothetical protein
MTNFIKNCIETYGSDSKELDAIDESLKEGLVSKCAVFLAT